MSGVATPQEIHVSHDDKLVLLTIQGVGTMKMPPDTAHHVARCLVDAANKCEGGKIIRPGNSLWPNLSKK
jgi:hypothetical protein